MHQEPTRERLEQKAEHEAVTGKDEAVLDKNWREAMTSAAMFGDHRLIFLEMIDEFEGI